MMKYTIAKITRYRVGLLTVKPPKSVNSIARVTAAITAPPRTQGLKRPQRVLVLSIILPINGSTKSSAILNTRIMVVTIPII